jgi:hypothetical protein
MYACNLPIITLATATCLLLLLPFMIVCHVYHRASALAGFVVNPDAVLVGDLPCCPLQRFKQPNHAGHACLQPTASHDSHITLVMPVLA